MSDRVTQIQQCAGKLSEIFFTSVGVLQRDATLIQVNPDIPITAWTPEQLEKNTIDLNSN